MVKSIPAILGEVELSKLFEKMAAQLAEFNSTVAVGEAIDKILAVIACHRQVRAGDHLNQEELKALVRDIERFDISCCPHGRPALIKIGRKEVDKWFKRT